MLVQAGTWKQKAAGAQQGVNAMPCHESAMPAFSSREGCTPGVECKVKRSAVFSPCFFFFSLLTKPKNMPDGSTIGREHACSRLSVYVAPVALPSHSPPHNRHTPSTRITTSSSSIT